MAGVAEIGAYKELMLVLGTAAVVVPAFMRIGLNPMFGFLAAGAILGPDAVGRLTGDIPWLAYISVTDRAQITHLAEAGIVFLLFMIGLEMSFERLWTLRRLVFVLGLAQVAVTGLVLTAAGGFLGIGSGPALLLGFAFALSSTALVVQLLADQKRLGSTTGRTIFSVLLFQDIAAVPLLVLVGVLSEPTGGLWTSLGQAAIKAVIAIGAILLFGRYMLRPLFRAVARTRSTELFMAASLLVVIGTGLVTAASGLSMALGAFIAGLILAETEFRREIEATIEPFKGLLIGVFFFSVGMSLDIRTIAAQPLVIMGAVALLLIVKATLVYLLARAFKTAVGAAVETAFLAASAGEFTLVLVSLAAAGRFLTPELAAVATAVAAISMALTPVLAWAGLKLKLRLQPPPLTASHAMVPPPPTAFDEHPDIIIAGYGRVGALVARMLVEHKLNFLAVETDPDLVARGRKESHPVFLGNAADLNMLARCGLGGAKVLIITMESRKATLEVAIAAKALHGDGLTVVARAKDADHAAQLYAAGVTEAVPEAIEASLHISEAALIAAGIPLGLAIAAIHEKRDQYRASYQRIAPAARDPVARLRSRRSALRKHEHEPVQAAPPPERTK